MNAGQYAEESAWLESEVLAVIREWHSHAVTPSDERFNSLALRILSHQLRYNTPYARFCASRGITLDALPSSWDAIPAVPVSAFKDAHLTTFDLAAAALRFETSGTTQRRPGIHYMENTVLYDAALLAGFDRAVLNDRARLRYLNVLPRPPQSPHSSLAYMMGIVGQARGDGHTGWYVRGDRLLIDAFVDDLRLAIGQGAAVCIAGTAFGLLNVIDALAERTQTFALPPDSRIMETGGFKGRARRLNRNEFYAALSTRFGIEQTAIVAEYGMTELTSQYYDALENRAKLERVKVSPPWLRARIVDGAGSTLPPGEIGTLTHVDLANRGSVLALWTDDLAYAAAGGFVLLGRPDDAPLRGCSLDAEELSAPA